MAAPVIARGELLAGLAVLVEPSGALDIDSRAALGLGLGAFAEADRMRCDLVGSVEAVVAPPGIVLARGRQVESQPANRVESPSTYSESRVNGVARSSPMQH